MSADTPDTRSDLEQILNVHCAAQEPGEHGAAAAAEPEPTGEIGPAGAGEQVGRWIADGGIGRRNVGLFAGLVVQQEQQGEDVNRSDGREKASGLLVFGVAQRTADGERSEEQYPKAAPRPRKFGETPRRYRGRLLISPLMK